MDQPQSILRIARGIAIVLGRGLVLLVMLFLTLLVLSSSIFTSVPALIWGPLTVANVALIVVLFRWRWTPRAVGVVMAGSLVVVLLIVIASQVLATTPPIVDVQGKPIPGSIATLEKVNLNGSEQWITIRGQNINNPILLNLGMGGPGGGGFTTRGFFEPLEDHYTVVSWDEPGTGKSYQAVPMRSLTPERFISDAFALAQMLRARFHQDKIYVYGTSWTSILGIWLVQRHPDLFYAYVGNGQMVSTIEDDVMGYQLALKYATEHGETATVETLRRNGPPPYTGDDLLSKYIVSFEVLNDIMGEPHYMIVVPIVPLFAEEYGWLDKINHTRGLVESFTVVYPQLRDLDFTTQAAKLDVPVYIFAGRDDVNAMSSLVERYYNVLQAPHKELIWLEGGHGLGDENLSQFVDVMNNRVLPQTFPGNTGR